MRIAHLVVAVAWSCSGGAAALADDPDPQQVLNEARALGREGKYEEALQNHLWFHENALRLKPSLTGVRLSFALSDWADLGRKYPRAREALVAIRDKDAAALDANRGDFELFMDVSSINDYLGEAPRTVGLFKAIEEKDPALAQRCFHVAEKVLAAQGEYETCSKYIPDAADRFGRIKEHLDMQLAMAKDFRPQLGSLANRSFAEETCRLIEILVGADRKPEADEVRGLALAVRDDPQIRDAVSRAVDRKAAAATAITLEGSPPVVIRTVPEAGAAEVDPGTTEIRVTFSKAMQDGSWSWSSASRDSDAATTGKPSYVEDKRTCVLPVKLEPGKTYALWLNSQKFRNFKDANGISAVPYLLVFKTKG